MCLHIIQTNKIYYFILISCCLLFCGLILRKKIVKYVYPHIDFCRGMLNFVKSQFVRFYTKSFLFYPLIFIALGIYFFLIYHFQIHYNFHFLNLFGLILTLMLIYRLYLDIGYSAILKTREEFSRAGRRRKRKIRKKINQ